MADFDASDHERPARVSRFDQWSKRARTCYRAAASIDNAKAALQAACLDVVNELGVVPGMGPLEEARRELLAAESALYAAREKLHAALKEKTLTPESRQPEFWKAGA